MIDLTLKLAAVVMVGLIARSAFLAARRPAFRIDLRGGEPAVRSGKTTPRFLADVRSIVAREGIRSGSIACRDRPGGAALEFSRRFPPAARQQVRNAWGALGRPGAPRRGRRGMGADR